jgi:antitoxin component YwqK of YwqJK toxin-antitoxin module
MKQMLKDNRKIWIIISCAFWLLANCEQPKHNVKSSWFKLSNNDSLISGYLIDGQRDGLWLTYNNDGSIFTINYYENGMLNGESFAYNENGELFDYGNYTNNKPDGKWTTFYSKKNNRIASTGNYSIGKKEGIWDFYYPNGMLMKKVKYIDGDIKETIIDKEIKLPK